MKKIGFKLTEWDHLGFREAVLADLQRQMRYAKLHCKRELITTISEEIRKVKSETLIYNN